MIDVVALLRAAAERIRRQGWRKRSIGPKHGETCAMGAVLWELDEYEGADARVDALAAARFYIHEELIALGVVISNRNTMTAILNWNDQQASVEPVLALLERAAARAEVARG